MKKNIFIILIITLLAGCGDYKITDEMFAGEWNCNDENYKSTWKDGRFQEYEKIYSEQDIKVLFKYENGYLYFKGGHDDDWIQESIAKKYNNELIIIYKKDQIDKATHSIQDKSDNTFKLIYESEVVARDEKNSQLNLKTKFESSCTRIK